MLDKFFNNSITVSFISFLRGKNPFSFAVKLSPLDSGIKILDKIIPKDINNNPITITITITIITIIVIKHLKIIMNLLCLMV